MKIFNRWCLIPVVLVGTCQSVQSLAEESFLKLSSSSPDISIKRRINDGRSIKLPGLQYSFHISAHCKNDQVPQSLLLSIADTRRRLSDNDLRESADLVLTVPPDQIAPVTAKAFCLNDDGINPTSPSRIKIHGLLSAQASMLCADAATQQTIYTSLALDLVLRCDEGEPRRENLAGD